MLAHQSPLTSLFIQLNYCYRLAAIRTVYQESLQLGKSKRNKDEERMEVEAQSMKAFIRLMRIHRVAQAL